MAYQDEKRIAWKVVEEILGISLDGIFSGTPSSSTYLRGDGTWSTVSGGGGGATILNGAGAPSGATGSDDDFYIDTTADAIYGPKTAGAWGSPTSLIGPAGSNGTDGTDGADGAGMTWTEAEIDFGSTPVYDATFTITDALITSSAVKVIVQPCGKAATGRTADDWQWDGAVFAANPGTGSATVYATFSPGPIVGKRKIQYSVVA